MHQTIQDEESPEKENLHGLSVSVSLSQKVALVVLAVIVELLWMIIEDFRGANHLFLF